MPHYANILNLNLDIIFEIGMWFSYYSSLFACFFIGFLGTRYFFFQKTEDAIAFGFCAMFSNGVLLGLPICALVFGDESLSINYLKIKNINDAINHIRKSDQNIFLITGSLYLVGKIRKKFL